MHNKTKTRLLSLDAFRGIITASMILVNNPGSWVTIYSPLSHSPWHGCSFADVIFPFFVFISGISIAFSLNNTSHQNLNYRLYIKLLRRTAFIFGLGILLAAFPFYNFSQNEWINLSNLRIMGVLQRLAICYLVCSLIFVHTTWKQQICLICVILIFYWYLITNIPVTECELTTIDDKTCNFAAFIDRLLLTKSHLWHKSKAYDPEGLLSTLGAISTCLIGCLCGRWLLSHHSAKEKLSKILSYGKYLIVAGLFWDLFFAMNKTLWTGSYVLFTAGLALSVFGLCYWLIDIKGYQAWSKPFIILGVNALALFVGSGLLTKLMQTIKFAVNGQTQNLQQAIFSTLFTPFFTPVNASLYYAITYVILWLILMGFLYHKKVYLKI